MPKAAVHQRACHLENYVLLHLKSAFLVDKKQDPFVIRHFCSRLNFAGAMHSFPESRGPWRPLCSECLWSVWLRNAMGQQDIGVKLVVI